ncbi:MAG: peptidoglycan DD-metalloendopeptidase family protein [Alphaproteobacteria bacterium]|jgi:murein DD-endopeptidase MepM/ murein hydrolase activator NlpD|nr:peptidoglycan DD-metalloendopeptidase family protein [Alphaproteobacteria bacterium]
MKKPLRILVYSIPPLLIVAAVGIHSLGGDGGDALPPSDVEGAGPAATAPASDSASEAGQFRTPFEDVRTVRRGDTLMALLVKAGMAPGEADSAIRAMAKVYKPRNLKPGQKVVLNLLPETGPGTKTRLQSMHLAASVEREIAVRRVNRSGFVAEAIDLPLTRTLALAEGHIETSLYKAGIGAGTPGTVLADLINIFSFDVDFQRDVQRGDAFAVMYERYLDEAGRMAKNGDVLVAAMTLSGKTTHLYRFETDDGTTDYFDAKGQSARRALLRTPIDGARLSSGYGRRRHPILGYTRMHRGLDFAASRGTPIYAAGKGVVEVAGRNGGYGRYIRIRHNGTYKTAYAHLRRFARGVRKGRRVRQGQIIGYVGTTGVSTGPHLHYEVFRAGRQVNPRRLKLPSGRKLKGAELHRFETVRAELDRQYAERAGDTKFAAAEASKNATCGPKTQLC